MGLFSTSWTPALVKGPIHSTYEVFKLSLVEITHSHKKKKIQTRQITYCFIPYPLSISTAFKSKPLYLSPPHHEINTLLSKEVLET